MAFGDGFRVCEAEAETGHKCHRGQARRARQEPDALRFEREIRVFPALAQTSTKNHCGHNAEASVRRVCGICGAYSKTFPRDFLTFLGFLRIVLVSIV